jgi:hypothetical protein
MSTEKLKEELKTLIVEELACRQAEGYDRRLSSRRQLRIGKLLDEIQAPPELCPEWRGLGEDEHLQPDRN